MSAIAKRILLTFAFIGSSFLVVSYIFIPSTIFVQVDGAIACNTAAASRAINNSFEKIFPRHSDTFFFTNDYKYLLQEPIYNGSHITINKNNKDYHTTLLLIQKDNDTCFLNWTTTIITGKNPIKKILNYLNAKSVKKSMEQATNHLQLYLSKPENAYDYRITHTTLEDTVLVFIQATTARYPSMDDTYKLINKLRSYILKNGAIETNSPMLHIAKEETGFTIMVGIPTNIELKPADDIVIKHLTPIENKILTVDVQGGSGSIKNAYKQIEQYMRDHSFSAPVIPYELMITERNKEPDTTKWKTRILYPII